MHSVDDKKNWRDAALTFPRPNAVATAPTIQSKCRGQQNVRKKSPSLKDDWWNENIHPSILPLAALSNTLKGIRDEIEMRGMLARSMVTHDTRPSPPMNYI